jgi:hypothetical protein
MTRKGDRRKLSESHVGHKLSEEAKRKIGEGNPLCFHGM